ncbi:ABC transporter ATP-binding protein [Hoeflea sp. YIM 152468]|uniref:ABC transporter ATP-binding protein n=1 Tax=Hoeflea sp. YIM 152468 TaxID=3031759 RepID=UPI0023DABB8E|nr:ABC transporter ATP-binding protein [Hoeflea sp. YIM 152468]MDF1609231.1 ABC transporter ATP-binding protein [Hoeflea sp. YIM 152468]
MDTADLPEAETVLRLTGITKRFGALVANDHISLALKRGEVVALLGENGAGKTTLMNILFGHYTADEGQIEVFGKALPSGDPNAALAAGIGMVHQHFALADQMTALENIVLGTRPLWSFNLGKAQARQRITQLASDYGLQVEPDRMIAELSVGERQRVEILKALYREARILILDEPTAVLTPMETEALFATLKKLVAAGLSVIFISHKLGEVQAVSDRVVVLRGGKLAGERKTSEATRRQLAELMVGGQLPVNEIGPSTSREILFELNNISTRSVGGAGLNGVSMQLRGGEITGLAGISGNGQAALAALIAGTLEARGGDIVVHGQKTVRWSPRAALDCGIGRIPEDRHATGMIGDMSVAENVISEAYRSPRFSRFGFLNWKAAASFASGIIKAYDVKCPSPEARVRLLSGGNMQKLILGRALDGDPDIIIASQPTRGLDVGAVAYVHARLIEARDRGAAVLLISEDLDEIQTLSDRIAVIHRGQLSRPSARGELSVMELGELMAGHGTEAGASHAA